MYLFYMKGLITKNYSICKVIILLFNIKDIILSVHLSPQFILVLCRFFFSKFDKGIFCFIKYKILNINPIW